MGSVRLRCRWRADLGYGTPEISLRPLFPIPWQRLDGTLDTRVNRAETIAPIDSFATLLEGRIGNDGRSIPGRLGFVTGTTSALPDALAASPGINYQYQPDNAANPTVDQRTPDLAAQLKFFNYPWRIDHLTSFGSWSDLFMRYALGFDYSGQPVNEIRYDRNPSSPTNNPLARSLLTDSPYELDLSSAQRRDTWAATFPNAASAFQTSLSQNDDAPFATADLERILRAFDHDGGSLPSRLWDVVDVFDPLKLILFDPFRTTSFANDLFDPVNRSIDPPNGQPSPELMAAAEQLASLSRRLVTTDSVDPPVAAGTVPNQAGLAVGPDGAPGRLGRTMMMTTNPIDEPDEINAPNSDDFRTLFGKDVAQANIIDLLRYRVWKQVRMEIMEANGWDEAAVAGLNDNEYRDDLLIPVSQLAEARITGETYVDTNGSGMYDAGDTFPSANDVNNNGVCDPPMAQVLAPEIYAGLRMDLNRPFGDGHDNAAADGLDNNSDGVADEPGEPGDKFVNGVVDDPLEAGEPFLDLNNNGKWDGVVEPFIDLFPGDFDGDGCPYDGPRDQLWANLTSPSGPITEPITFDYTNGQGVQLHPQIANALSASPFATVRNLNSQARQMYARHLYCLMLLLVDENYIAPWDSNDPQIMKWVEDEKKKLTDSGIVLEQADFIIKHKLTCRMIAQWAVNCTDMCDSDVIMTPFEYDEMPWDGWGCRDANANLVPIDGDAATDENKGQMIAWKLVARQQRRQADHGAGGQRGPQAAAPDPRHGVGCGAAGAAHQRNAGVPRPQGQRRID